jgi:hypothetical protein
MIGVKNVEEGKKVVMKEEEREEGQEHQYKIGKC